MIKYSGSTTTHTIKLEHNDTNWAFAFMYEALGLLEAGPKAGDDAARELNAGQQLMKALAEAANIDYAKYDGPRLLQATSSSVPDKREARR